MLFSWLRARRRRKLLAEPFPIRWAEFLDRNVGHYPLLPASDQARLRAAARILIAEKEWLGRGGLFVTEEMKVTIAAQAALLLLGADRGYFARVRVVVFRRRSARPWPRTTGRTTNFRNGLARPAVACGAVLLEWEEVVGGGRNPGAGDTGVVHGFGHQRDFLDGLTGGR